MRRRALIPILSLALGLAACSARGGTGLGTMDGGATRACRSLQQVVDNRAVLTPDQLRQQLGVVYDAAQTSENAVIQARAVALYADATVIASGGEPVPLDADLNAMQAACSGAQGS